MFFPVWTYDFGDVRQVGHVTLVQWTVLFDLPYIRHFSCLFGPDHCMSAGKRPMVDPWVAADGFSYEVVHPFHCACLTREKNLYSCMHLLGDSSLRLCQYQIFTDLLIG